jgi:hypothetical protein
MLGSELITHLRESILDDVALPQLWSDSELLRFLNYAEVQACRRAHLLIDSSTANDNGTAATAGTMGQKPLCTLSVIANQATYNLSPKILQIKRCQLRSMVIPLTGPVVYPELDDLVSGWMGTGGVVTGAGNDGVQAKGTIVSDGTLGTAGAVVTVGTNGYTFVATLSAENHVLRGTSGADDLDHLKSAINNGGTSALHICSAVHPKVTAAHTVSGTAGTMTLTAKLNGTAGNGIALLSTDAHLVMSGTYMTGGVDNSGEPTYFLNEPGNTITFVRSPSYDDTADLVVSRIPLTSLTKTTSPEIDEQYHLGLCDWAAHLAYMKSDTETQNLNLSKFYENQFDRQFGTLPDAYIQKLRKSISQKQRMRPREFGS